jgi:hypothetical protein
MEPMEPKEACLRVLGEAGGETLHWTVVLDRALAALAKEGRVDKQGAGLYRAKAELN